MQYEIITDSCANLTDEQIEKYGVHIFSLSYNVGTSVYESYKKGKKTDLAAFYTLLRRKEKVTTSCVNATDVTAFMEDFLKKGRDILFITFSSALSATYEVIANAAGELRRKYPERKLSVIDSLSASMGQGLLVHYAIVKRGEGMSLEELAAWVEENRFNICHWFTVDDLFFLKRGGRVSATAAVAGSILGIKPILHVDDAGRLIPTGKVRGRKNSLVALVDKIAETGINPKDQIMFLAHGDSLADAEEVRDMIMERFAPKDVVLNYIDPVIGAHSGPGTIALFFFGSKR